MPDEWEVILAVWELGSNSIYFRDIDVWSFSFFKVIDGVSPFMKEESTNTPSTHSIGCHFVLFIIINGCDQAFFSFI